MRNVLFCAAVGCCCLILSGCPLRIVNVSAPDINCKYDNDCTITVNDSIDTFSLLGTGGEAFLQTRTWPVGEPGTVAEGLYGYEYRLDLIKLTGIGAAPCVRQLIVDFGPIVTIDYDDDGTQDHVYVITGGGVGSVAPSSASKSGNTVTFEFNPPVCCSTTGPGAGESSYFFGLTSARPAHGITAQIRDTTGATINLAARAPQPAP